MGCPHLGQRGSFPCKYPLRLAYSTVDWYIGKLRSIFSAIGRLGDWRRTLLIGNPSSDLSVKQYLKEFTAEQLRASFAPKQGCAAFCWQIAFAFSTHRENVFSSRPSCQLTCLSPPEIKRSSRLFSLLMAEHCGDPGQVKISDTARFSDEWILITFGERLWGMGSATSLACAVTPTQDYALFNSVLFFCLQFDDWMFLKE